MRFFVLCFQVFLWVFVLFSAPACECEITMRHLAYDARCCSSHTHASRSR